MAIPDDDAGEVPKAYVVKSAQACVGKGDEEIRELLLRHVWERKSHHQQLRGGVEFLDSVPRNASGKILRRLLRERDGGARKIGASKL